MQSEYIILPSIRDDEKGYVYLFRLAEFIMANPYRYFEVSFRNCSILEQNAVAMLGSLARFVEDKNTLKNVSVGRLAIAKYRLNFQINSMNSIIGKQLTENNFLPHFTNINYSYAPSGGYIGYREHLDYLDIGELAYHLSNEWLSDEKISISSALKSSIVTHVIEIFMNAYGHGIDLERDGLSTVISCSQYDVKAKLLKLTVIDFGSGIVEKVKEHTKLPMFDTAAMEWALTMGNSTKTDSITEDIPRGVGFGILNAFVRLNGGSIKIFSNSCTAELNKEDGYSVSLMKTPFGGTMITISLNCDDRLYQYADEKTGTERYY